MSAETAAEVLPCMQVLTTAPASPHRCCSKPPNPKAAGHVWYDFFWDVIPHASAHHSARLSPQVRLLLGRDPAYEPASEAGERPMGVEFWAVSGTGRWLQGCMRSPPMAGPRRRPRGTTGPESCAADERLPFHRVQNAASRGVYYGMPSVYQDQVYTGSRYTRYSRVFTHIRSGQHTAGSARR
jgi:hypothetical protein